MIGRPTSRALAGLAAIAVGAVLLAGASANAQGTSDAQRRVLPIERRTSTIIRRVNSISGDVRTEETPDQVEVTLAADVLFAFDQADLSPAAAAKIGELAAQLTAEGQDPVTVVGYTDAKGTDTYNADLSQRRAAAVRDALTAKAPGFTYTVEGRGAADPVAPNTNDDGSDNPAGRERNRRVTITFARTS